MKERPILFSAPMVRALLEGRKTQTRRIVKGKALAWIEQAGFTPEFVALPENHLCPYGQPGDRLWVRETWRYKGWRPISGGASVETIYRADGAVVDHFRERFSFDEHAEWRPSIFMPRWAARILLEITEVRIERLQDISEEDAVAEGVEAKPFPGPWWQGYMRMDDGELIHQQCVGEAPPDWMIEPKPMKPTPHLDRSAIDMYRILWESINGAGSWDKNPFVWAIEFKRTDHAK